MGWLGIDPSQRHTGLCHLTVTEAFLYEIKTGDLDVLSSAAHIRLEFKTFVKKNNPHRLPIFCIEKQLSVGGHSSSLMFHMQMNVFETIKLLAKEYNEEPTIIAPLPIQLQSYCTKLLGLKAVKGKTYVDEVKRLMKQEGRMSIHKADAYCLARLGRDVIDGVWSYKLPQSEAPLFPWKVTNGQ